VLQEQGSPHTCRTGSLTFTETNERIPLHFWIDLPNGIGLAVALALQIGHVGVKGGAGEIVGMERCMVARQLGQPGSERGERAPVVLDGARCLAIESQQVFLEQGRGVHHTPQKGSEKLLVRVFRALIALLDAVFAFIIAELVAKGIFYDEFFVNVVYL